MTVLDIINQELSKSEGVCPRCGKPRPGVLRSTGKVSGRGTFQHGSAHFSSGTTQTKDNAGVCNCKELS